LRSRSDLCHRPELNGALRAVAVLGPSPIPPVIVTRALSVTDGERLRTAFLAMHEDAEDREILGDGLIARFVGVRDADYDPIRAMIAGAIAADFTVLG
jgi:phosphonate transport system substrate-binding protein